MRKRFAKIQGIILFAAFLANSITISRVSAQTPAESGVRQHYQSNRLPPKQQNYYSLIWGVDSFSVKSVESGQIIRFSYRVLDVAKAKALNDEKAQASLIDGRAGVQLVVPSLENIGQLRQTAAPEAGKNYWMAFSNKGSKVKPGDRVSVVIGSFKVDNLIIQ
jgi:hypothetical protein